MPSFLVPTKVGTQETRATNTMPYGTRPPIVGHGRVAVQLAVIKGDPPTSQGTPTSPLPLFWLTINEMPLGEPQQLASATQAPLTYLDFTQVKPGIYALGVRLRNADPALWQGFCVPIIVGAVQEPSVVPVCPGFSLQGVRRNEGAMAEYIDLGE